MSRSELLRSSSARSAVVCLLVAAGCAAAAPPSNANSYAQTNLISDIAGVATFTDSNLINPWGLAATPTSPIWIADNNSGTSILFNAETLSIVPLVVTIPPPMGSAGPSTPTGTVFNGTGKFLVGDGAPGLFLFATEDGTISGWNPGTGAVLKVDNSASGAVYKGLALVGGVHPMLYATNFHAGTIDVFDSSFNPVDMSGRFVDPFMPKGYAPFGISAVTIGTDPFLLVTYAKQDAAAHDDVAGVGNGFVDEFQANGIFVRRLITRGVLDSPWGLAMAPSTGFGAFNGALLVGNFGDGRINAFKLSDTDGDSNIDTATFLDALRTPDGHPITILGLWGLRFGNGAAGGPVDALFFSAGIPGSLGDLSTPENHGLFGDIMAAPVAP